MSKEILGVDVDLCVVDTGEAHWDWLCSLMKGYKPFPEGNDIPYNLAECFGIPKFGLEFWRDAHLYDDLLPIPGSVEVLKRLSEDLEIVFVSQIKGHHNKSKWRFLEKHFPFLSGYVATKEKQYARCDLFIDDRLNHLERMPAEVVTIQRLTPYQQTSRFVPDYKFKDWNEVLDIFYKEA